MEIRIKTAEEFRDSHVTVTVKASDNDEALRVVAALVGGPPAEGYDPAAAVDTLADNYRRARDRIADLEADITRRVDNEKMVYKRLGDLEVRALDLGEALAAERKQADKSAIEIDKVMEELVKTRTERDQLRDKAAQKPSILAQAVSKDRVERDLIEARQVIRQIAGLIARPGVQAAIAGAPEGTVMAGVLIKIDEIATGHLQGVTNQT